MYAQDPIVKLHLSQHYSDDDGDFMPDDILKRYPTLSNEALYVVDCKYAQLEVLTNNFKQITGIDTNHKNEILPLLEHASRNDDNMLYEYSHKLLSACFGIDSSNKFVQDDINSCIYKTHDDRIILKSAGLLSRDSSEQIRYTVGKLTDVTGLVDYTKFNYKFTGPNSKKTFALFNDLSDLEYILSKRELQILVLIGKGMLSKEIANNLFISFHTVQTHRKNIHKKLETSTSMGAYNKAKDMGLFFNN